MEQNLRQEILEKVKQFYFEEHMQKQKHFEPGKDIITFAAKVYDEDEMMNLVDASLDFWLTTGRLW